MWTVGIGSMCGELKLGLVLVCLEVIVIMCVLELCVTAVTCVVVLGGPVVWCSISEFFGKLMLLVWKFLLVSVMVRFLCSVVVRKCMVGVLFYGMI